MEQVQEYFVEVRIYRDTNKATYNDTKRFETINNAIEYLERVRDE